MILNHLEVFFCGFLITYTAHFMYNITVPSRYVALLNVCNCKTFRRGKGKGFLVRYFTYTPLLVGL